MPPAKIADHMDILCLERRDLKQNTTIGSNETFWSPKILPPTPILGWLRWWHLGRVSDSKMHQQAGNLSCRMFPTKSFISYSH